jgi:hypothetical protein
MVDRSKYLDLLGQADKRAKADKLIKDAAKETILKHVTEAPTYTNNKDEMHPAIKEAIERAMKRSW